MINSSDRPRPVPEDLRRQLADLGRQLSALPEPEDPAALVAKVATTTRYEKAQIGRESVPASRAKTIIRRLKPLTYVVLWAALGVLALPVNPAVLPIDLVGGSLFAAQGFISHKLRRTVAPLVGLLQDRFQQSKREFVRRAALIADVRETGLGLRKAAVAGDRTQIAVAFAGAVESVRMLQRSEASALLDRVPAPDLTHGRLKGAAHRVVSVLERGTWAGRWFIVLPAIAGGVVASSLGLAESTPAGSYLPLMVDACVFNIGLAARDILTKHDAVTFVAAANRAIVAPDEAVLSSLESARGIVGEATEVVQQIEASAMPSVEPEISRSADKTLDAQQPTPSPEPPRIDPSDPTTRPPGGPGIGF